LSAEKSVYEKKADGSYGSSSSEKVQILLLHIALAFGEKRYLLFREDD
jgi:hypothetical protein